MVILVSGRKLLLVKVIKIAQASKILKNKPMEESIRLSIDVLSALYRRETIAVMIPIMPKTIPKIKYKKEALNKKQQQIDKILIIYDMISSNLA